MRKSGVLLRGVVAALSALPRVSPERGGQVGRGCGGDGGRPLGGGAGTGHQQSVAAGRSARGSAAERAQSTSSPQRRSCCAGAEHQQPAAPIAAGMDVRVDKNGQLVTTVKATKAASDEEMLASWLPPVGFNECNGDIFKARRAAEGISGMTNTNPYKDGKDACGRAPTHADRGAHRRHRGP